MRLLAVSAVGDDRPGIIAGLTGVLAGLGGNLEDTSMTILRGHFAMMLLVACEQPVPTVETALAPVAAEHGLLVSVREVSGEPPASVPGTHFVLTLHGADRPGIVSRVSGLVAARGGNVTDLTTRLAGSLYVVTLELDLDPGAELSGLREDLARLAAELGVQAALHAADADLL